MSVPVEMSLYLLIFLCVCSLFDVPHSFIHQQCVSVGCVLDGREREKKKGMDGYLGKGNTMLLMLQRLIQRKPNHCMSS